MKTAEAQKVDRQFESDPRWQLALRVASSRILARSARLPQFLLHVTAKAIEGKVEEISEQQIGVHVFGRPSDYRSGEDNIVRAHARLLRKKLDEYFEGEGRLESIRIRIPKGGYCPVFEPSPETGTEFVPAELPAEARRRGWRKGWRIAAAVLMTVLAVVLVSWVKLPSGGSQSESARFWAQLFNRQRPTFVVPSDTGLVIYQRLAGKELTLSEYINRQFEPVRGFQSESDPFFASSVTRSRYTNMPDMEFCWRLAQHPGLELTRTSLRFARELRMGDFKGANAVLIGARRSNPWVELFHGGQNFQALFDGEKGIDYISNASPRQGEQAVYSEIDASGQRWAYSVVSFTGGLNGQGSILMVGGTTTAGTEGAIDFVLNEQKLNGFLRKVTGSGGLIPHFELLLKTGNVAGNARESEVLGYRVQPGQ